ncbi:flavin prenyltransferase UbiX [Psychrosphaera sp. 1_MG-2023]|uniref:flavin prenyltransferase UbiX n=1 Tax=Psychrosphaera sp. 1_MG-2023 TaxID=3062643 RepID=UPI0026E114E4|nr:flavin prenyltransferase UbiX [Psychrosphaera sp. 1_MG-2023]MDO6720966.1 flavin prenyltransferase UbiX [Psychrosphaera sp. 1_MG-2023]
MTQPYSGPSLFAGEVTIGVTGASGAPYTLELIKQLVAANHQIYLLFSSAAKVVFKTEVELDIPAHPEKASQWCENYFNSATGQICVLGKDQWFSPPASGSAAPKNMIVVPCSTGTLSAIANGTSDNLLERAADVVIKERGNLILVPRETPFSAIHLENMLKLSRLGVTIMPAAPGFYHQPKSIDDLVQFMVARMLDHLRIEQTLVPRWGYTNKK